MLTSIAHLIQELLSRFVRMAVVAVLSASPAWGGSAASPALADASASPPNVGGSDELGDEASQLERAMDSLRNGDPGRALSLCNEDAIKYPRGVLAQERELVAIEALVRLGRAPEAKARARELMKHYPDSLFIPRVRRMVREATSN